MIPAAAATGIEGQASVVSLERQTLSSLQLLRGVYLFNYPSGKRRRASGNTSYTGYNNSSNHDLDNHGATNAHSTDYCSTQTPAYGDDAG